jgi:hypothetical protein
MRKLIVAAAVATLASLGAVRQVNAQAFYPGQTAGTPITRGSYNPHPGTYGTYPRQAPVATSSRRDDDRYARHDGRDDDDRRSYDAARRRNDERGSQYRQYGQNGRYGQSGYGTRSTTSAPSRIAEHTPVTNTGRRDANWNRR